MSGHIQSAPNLRRNFIKCALTVPKTCNVGDYIQCLAVLTLLGTSDVDFVDRESLADNRKEKEYDLLIVNGWFAHSPAAVFPIRVKAKRTIVSGFHLSKGSQRHFREHQLPIWRGEGVRIGARDPFTYDWLKAEGYDNCFISGCPTIHLLRPKDQSGEPYNLINDLSSSLFNRNIVDKARFLTADISVNLSIEEKLLIAKHYLSSLGLCATLYTSRLHSALPALGAAVPVVFLGDPSNERLSLLRFLGVKVVPLPTTFPRANSLHDFILTLSRICDPIFRDNSYRSHVSSLDPSYVDFSRRELFRELVEVGASLELRRV